MNDEELEALIDDHYLGEAQTLTTGAEHNLLKLAELRGVLTETAGGRWEEIKRTFHRMAAMGGDQEDPVTRVTGILGLLSERLSEIGRHIETAVSRAPASEVLEGTRELSVDFGPYLEQLNATVAQLGSQMATQTAERATEPTAQSQTTLDPAVFEVITDRLSGLARGLEAIGGAIDSATRTRPAAGASAQQVRVIQTLQSGVHDLLEDLVETIDQGLMDSLRGVDRWLERQGMQRDPRLEDLIDRTLAGLDQLKDLAAALKKIDTRSLVSEATEAEKGK